MTNKETIKEAQAYIEDGGTLELIINAISKQIPKKLAILPEPYINAKKYGCCPTCQWTEIDYRWGMREGTTITYCPRCGQALSWEVEND